MIRCPVCKHEEYDGTLYCSDCGTQLWEGEAKPDEDAQDTQRFAADDLSRPGEAQTDDQPAATAPATCQIILRIKGHTNPLYLTGRTEFRLGRRDPKHGVRPDVDLAPYRALELGVSRIHAALTQNGASVSITDLGSTNGTLINGARLKPNAPQPLRDGDELRLGKLTLRVFFEVG